MNRAGGYVNNLSGDLAYKSYRPAGLPLESGLEYGPRIVNELGAATRSLAELDTMARLIPDASLFLAMYIRKEALISSQIEGTQCTIDDILDPEAEANAGLDVAEVLSYVRAINYALERLKELPLCCRLFRDVHRVLLDNARGNDKEPGEFRVSQNWIGPAGCSLKDARYIPPNVEDMRLAMSNLEKYINLEDDCDPLVRAALVHYQFETIHPFLDGNGRMGRMLILLCLMEWGLLHSPIIYVSYFLKKNQWEYYGKLANVRDTGNYEQWVLFFMEAVHAAARDAIQTIHDLERIQKNSLARIRECSRSGGTLEQVFNKLAAHPIISTKSMAAILNISRNTASKYISVLTKAGILVETTNRSRNRVFAYAEYLDILRKDTQ